MAQITIYINHELESRVKEMAKAHNMSISRFISRLLEQNIRDNWRPEVKSLAGSWKDFPTLEEIRGDETEDIEREAL